MTAPAWTIFDNSKWPTGSRELVGVAAQFVAPHKTYIAMHASPRIVAGVQSADLTPEQADALKRQIRPMLVYLRRLTQRMNRRRFPSDDPLFRTALAAFDALHALHVHVHYLSCPSGVRQIPTEREGG